MTSKSNDLNCRAGSLKIPELLVLKKQDQGPGSTFKPQASSVLAQVKDFLPRLALSNQHLQQAVENGENVDIENVENTDGPLIQMDLALVEQDSDSEVSDSDSSEESIQGEVTEQNLKLRPKAKNKPNIEVINNGEVSVNKCVEKNTGFEDG